jgi:hypothetical protein
MKEKKKQYKKEKPQIDETEDLLTCESEDLFEKRSTINAISIEKQSVSVSDDPKTEKTFPSLYDSIPTTFGAIALGMLVLTGVQLIVKRIFDREKKDHKALTQFVTSMFALIVGIWIADKLIAGPSTDILWEQESRDVLVFIKDITLMVFAYYFGVKAQAPKDE